MAKGIAFPESNLTLVGSPEEQAAGTVYDLHAHRFRDLDGQPHVITKWRFSPEELREVVANGGECWLWATGETQPPVSIEGFSPWKDQK